MKTGITQIFKTHFLSDSKVHDCLKSDLVTTYRRSSKDPDKTSKLHGKPTSDGSIGRSKHDRPAVGLPDRNRTLAKQVPEISDGHNTHRQHINLGERLADLHPQEGLELKTALPVGIHQGDAPGRKPAISADHLGFQNRDKR